MAIEHAQAQTMAKDAEVTKGDVSSPTNLAPACLPDVPVTMERPPPEGLEAVIPDPGRPRANLAISKEKPFGTPTSPPNSTVVQQHLHFFDTDGDGIIWPWDTYNGFRRLGFNPISSFVATAGLQMSAIFTSPSMFVNPLLPYYIKNAHRGKHGSDTGVYDTEGRFVPQKFEEIFSKYDKGNKGGLDLSDIRRMISGNSLMGDFAGWAATRGEWYMTWLMCYDERGVLSKEKIRAMYDGSLFQIVADEVAAKRRGEKKVTDEAARGKGVGNASFYSTGGIIGVL
ncbi:Caleosin-domain-containing protein [Haematococcus lacustris]